RPRHRRRRRRRAVAAPRRAPLRAPRSRAHLARRARGLRRLRHARRRARRLPAPARARAPPPPPDARPRPRRAADRGLPRRARPRRRRAALPRRRRRVAAVRRADGHAWLEPLARELWALRNQDAPPGGQHLRTVEALGAGYLERGAAPSRAVREVLRVGRALVEQAEQGGLADAAAARRLGALVD